MTQNLAKYCCKNNDEKSYFISNAYFCVLHDSKRNINTLNSLN